MSKLQNNQKGFAAVELLLVIIIVILVGFIGWFIYHTDHKTTATTKATATTSKPAASTNSKPVSYFTITEWGVRAPYSGSLTLEYTVTNNSGLTYASFSSAQLDAADNQCQSEGNGGGAVERYASTDMVADETGESSGQTPQQYLESGGFGGLNGGNYAHIGNYYYFYVQPNGTCTSTQTGVNIESQTTSAVKALVQNLQAVPSE